MCGHVGIAGALEFRDEGTMKRLLLIDYLRGQDSTGLAAIRKTDEVKIAKAAVNPLDLFDMQRFKDALVGHSSKAFIGHNRAATKGAINNTNAHPYQVDHIIGAHNGTLLPASYKELEDTLGEKFGTDSHAIIASIARLGIEKTVKMLQGAWALVWFDLSSNTLNFLRNKERPLWYSYTDDFKKILWASEWPMMEVATKIVAPTPAYSLYHSKDNHRFFQLAEDTWYRYDLAALTAGGTTVPKPKAKKLTGKEVVATLADDPFMRGKPNYFGQHTGRSTMTTKSPSDSNVITMGLKEDPKDVKILHLYGSKESPVAGLLSKEKFDEIAQYGCSWCSASVDYTESGVTIFERDQICLCPTCSGGSGQATRIHIPDLEALL